MRYLIVLLLAFVTACAPLSHHDSALGDVGEVAGRVLLCPLTLCTSELMMADQYQRKQQQEAHNRWYWSLSPAERARQDQREAAAMQALGMALSGGGPRLNRAPTQIYTPPPTVNCVSRQLGTTVYTDCQ